MKLVKPVVKTLSWCGWHRVLLLVVLSGTSPGDTCSDKAAKYTEVRQDPNTRHSLHPTALCIERLPRMPVLGGGWDRVLFQPLVPHIHAVAAPEGVRRSVGPCGHGYGGRALGSAHKQTADHRQGKGI